MTRVLPSASGGHWRPSDPEAQLLARALRAGRLTVLVGASGVGKTTLLVAGVLPLLHRRVGGKPEQPGGAPQVVDSFTGQRRRVQGHGQDERLYFVDQWDAVSLGSLVRTLDELPATARVRFDAAEAMSPAYLAALSQRHGGARLLFVFDHFELLFEGAQHNLALQRFVDAWAAVVQAPDLNVHFLVAIDEHAWPRLQTLCDRIPTVELQALRLQARTGRRELESLIDGRQGEGAAREEVSAADFATSLNASLSRVAKSVREAEPRLKDFAASLSSILPRVSSAARHADPSPFLELSPAKRQAFVESLGARLARPAAEVAPVPDPSGPARERDAAAEAVRQAAAERERELERERAAEAERMAQAQRAAEAAQAAEAERRIEAARHAEAARQAEAAQQVELHRLAQALAAAEAAVAREVQAREAAEAAANAAEAAAKAAEAEQHAEAERRAKAEQDAEAARHAGAAQLAEAHRLAQALAAAESAAAREAQARQAAEAQQQAQEESVIAAAMSLPQAGTTDATAGIPAPASAAARPARTGLLWGAALLAAAAAAVLWWPTQPTPPAAPVVLLPEVAAPPPMAETASAPAPTSPVVAASAAEPVPVESGRYEMLAATADGTHARITRELAAALSTGNSAMQVVPLADGAAPITGLQAPSRLAIARFDVLHAAHGRAAPPLRVLTPLFPEEVLFIVRADSPLKYIHELRGRRLSIGPVQGDGSNTVRAIYRHLFGVEMIELAQLYNDQALAELVAFRSIDAMAIVEPLPSAWWASLDPRTTRRLRVLTLDPRHPADRSLLGAPGISMARIGADVTKDKRTTTPAVMSFLVASGEGDADVDRLTAMARALCRELPRLREHGHPKWRALQPAAQLDTGWPLVRPFQAELGRCARR